jgi:hypothetical protein
MMYQPYSSAQKAMDYASKLAQMRNAQIDSQVNKIKKQQGIPKGQYKNSVAVPLPYHPAPIHMQPLPYRPAPSPYDLPYLPANGNTGITGGLGTSYHQTPQPRNVPNDFPMPQNQVELQRRYNQLRMMGY